MLFKNEKQRGANEEIRTKYGVYGKIRRLQIRSVNINTMAVSVLISFLSKL